MADSALCQKDVELVQVDVGEHRGEGTTLRQSLDRLQKAALPVAHRRAQPTAQQRQTPRFHVRPGQQVEKNFVIDDVEELRDIRLDDPTATGC